MPQSARKKTSPKKTASSKSVSTTNGLDKYALYEKSVQSPDLDMDWFTNVYRNIRQKEPQHLREDFCGTFALSCEWVKRGEKHTAVGLDLDPEPIAYGKKHHETLLSADQKKRLTILKQNVMSVTEPKADFIVANNFSFYIFKQRAMLIEYLRNCLKSLKSDGIVILEMVGGPGMIEKTQEKKTVHGEGGEKFQYIWDQKSFDPISRNGHYAIHFKFPDGRAFKDAFTYDWRIWTIPEVREAMLEAGFADTCIFWEYTHKDGTEEYMRSEKGDNDWSWIAYAVGMRKP